MSQKPNLWDKFVNWLMGEPVPALSQSDLQLLRDLSRRVEVLSDRLKTPPGEAASASPSPSDNGNLDEVREQLQKLAKTQFKANNLQETQQAQLKEALEGLQKALAGQETALAELARQREQAVESARLEALKRILPALDSLDAAFNSGKRQVLQLPMSPETRRAVVAWLDGLRLARLRLLDVLSAYDIHPIPTLGRPFDPHYHLAVAADSSGRAADGIIVGQDRPGYASSTKVLREAEVIVARSAQK